MLSQLERIATFCERQGAEAELMGVRWCEIIVTMQRSDINVCLSQHVSGMSVRTVVKNSVGFASCNTLEENMAKETAEKAMTMSRKTPPLPFSPFAPARPFSDVPGLYDPAAEDFDEEAAISTTERLLEAIQEDKRAAVDSGEFSLSVREKALFTTRGVCVQEKKSRFSWFIIALAREGESVGSFEYQYGCTTRVRDVEVEAAARAVAARAVANLHPEKAEPFTGEVILGPEAVTALVGDPLIFALNANNVHRQQSVLAGSRGACIAPREMTVRDNPMIPGDFNSSTCDREGQPHQAHTLVEKGVLTDYLYDSLSANEEGRPSTGNATGTFREIPRIGITSFMIEKGSHSLETLIRETRKGLLISRFSGTADRVSGDFSGAVKGAQLIEKGEIKHALKEAVIAGNLYTLLPQVTAVSREVLRYPKMVIPYLKVEEMHVTA